MFRNEVCSPDTLDGPIANTLIAAEGWNDRWWGRPPQSLSRQRLEPGERRIGGAAGLGFAFRQSRRKMSFA